MPSDLVLLLILPALLYWESLTTSLREIRAIQRVIALVSVVLVILTAAAWPRCCPPWAWRGDRHGSSAPSWPHRRTAVAGVSRGIPRRILTTLRTESLINDGTALVAYAIAVHAVTEPVTGYVAERFVLSWLGGVLAGLVT